MPHTFDADVIAAVLRHMNGDHTDDNILIARAFSAESESAGESAAEITESVMTGFDGEAAWWDVTRAGVVSELRVPWPGGPIADRPSVRRQVVALYDAACARLGVEPRPHD